MSNHRERRFRNFKNPNAAHKRIVCLLAASCLALSSSVAAQAKKFSAPINLSDLSSITSDVSFISASELATQRISNDGKHVVFIADRDFDNASELFSVPIEGGPLIKLNAALSSIQDINDFVISPDSQLVVYSGDQTTVGIDELYSVPITGGVPVKLNGTMQPAGDIGFTAGFLISPDGQFVVYRADQDVDGQNELYSVPIAGGTVQKLSGTMVSGGDVQISSNDVQISPDSQRVVFLADRVTDGVIELFSTSITGGNPVKISGTLPVNSDVNDDFVITSDSTKVVYEADQTTAFKDELFAVGIAGGVPVALTSGMQADGDNQGINPDETALVTPDSNFVVFRADFQSDNVSELFRVPITGGAPTKLNGPLQLTGDVQTDAALSPDGSTVAYKARVENTSGIELFTVPISGSSQLAQKISGSMVAGGNISSTLGVVKFTPDSKSVLFVADAEVNGVNELYKVAADGSGSRLRVNQPIPVGPTGISSPSSAPGGTFQISQNGKEVLYLCRCRADVVGQAELFVTSINGGTPERVNDELPDSIADINRAHFSPDGQFIVYNGDQEIVNVDELYSVERQEQELCVPVKTSNNKVALICI